MCANYQAKWTTFQNFKNLSVISRAAPPRDHVCQFSVKMENIFVLITLMMLQRSGWRLKWARWRWVHGLVKPIFLIWRKNNISLSKYLDFCAFVRSTSFKICDDIIGIVRSGIFIYVYLFSILNSPKKNLVKC